MRISPSCYAATGLAYSAPWSVNAGIAAGKDITLVVDTGSNALSAATLHGYAECARPGNSIRVINTEKHFDHIGGNSYFSRHDAEIWGHAEIRRTEDEFRAEIEEFNQAITNPARRAAGEARAFFAGTELKLPDVTISADCAFDLGACPVSILLSPGHTATNLSVWLPGEGVLMCGDCLVNGYIPNLDEGTPAEWETWLLSLDRLAALGPEVLVTGHGAVARGTEIGRLIDRHRQWIGEAIRSGHSPTTA